MIDVKDLEQNSQTSPPDLTNAVAAEWSRIPAATLHTLEGRLPRRVELIITAVGNKSGTGCSTRTYGRDDQVSTYFWPDSVCTAYMHVEVIVFFFLFFIFLFKISL